jgi:hypothetical protein
VARTPKNPNPDDSDAPALSPEDEVAMREIDEAVRKDDLAGFLQKYGVAIGSVLIIFLLSFGGYLFYNLQVEAALEADSEEIVSILDYAQAEDFRSVKERTAALLDDETPGVRTSARLLHAAAALETDEPDRAIELYAQIAADQDAPQALRDLARLREVATGFDSLEPADAIARLADLAEPENPFFASAAELTAMAHLEAGNREEAGTLFAAIAKDESLPQTLRDRALQMTGQLGVDAIDDVDQLLEEQGGAPAAAPAGVPAAPPAQ